MIILDFFPLVISLERPYIFFYLLINMCYRIRGRLGNLVFLAINFSSSPSLIIVEKHENFAPIVIDGLAIFCALRKQFFCRSI